MSRLEDLLPNRWKRLQVRSARRAMEQAWRRDVGRSTPHT
jgi:hypothetical protein